MPTPIAAHQEAGRRLARADLLDLLDRSRDYALTLLLAPPRVRQVHVIAAMAQSTPLPPHGIDGTGPP
jgi:hypothetical protein